MNAIQSLGLYWLAVSRQGLWRNVVSVEGNNPEPATGKECSTKPETVEESSPEPGTEECG